MSYEGSTESSECSDDEEEVEPHLKYQRLGGSVAEILKKDSATCLGTHPRLLALGTQWGMVHILDFNGDEIKKFACHSKAVNAVCVDSSGEFVASAGQDGQVVVNSLYSDSSQTTASFGMPLYGVGLSPGYAKDNKRFATGGAAGRLTMNDKGWISSVKTKVLHSEDGPVYALAWRGRYIVWACDKGIMVWDVQAHRRITLIRRPKDSPPPDAFNCSLCWRDDHTFVIGWADSIRVAAIKAKVTGDSRATTGMFVEIIGMFRTEYWVCGVAPYLSDSLVVLAYIPEEEVDPSEDNDEGVIEGDVLQHGTARKPELVITSLSNEETSSDALSIVNYEQYIANDYHMAFLEEEHIYFVVSPKDIVVARQRDSDDHVSWLLDHEKYPEALVAVREGEEKKELRVHTIESVGDHYIEHLLSCTRYDEAADVCRDIYDTNAEGWQKWIDMFLKKGQARAIAPLVPTENPQLPSEVYTSLLLSLAEGEVAECTVLRELIGQWDAHLYSSAEAKTAVLDNLRVAEGERERLLKSTLAQIYRDMDKPHKAVPILLDLGEGDVLELIYEHALSEQLLAHLDRLLVLDREKTIQYLLDHKEQIKVNTIVDKLRKDPLHLFYYLDALSSEDLAAGAPFHDLQVALCAEYAPEKLMELLKHSNFYSLEKALQVCRERDLVPQTVFLYSRIGNNKQALQLIIDRLGDVHMAINFAKEQNDAELWDDLIVYSADKPEFIRGLLNNIGTHVDPIVLIRRIPLGLPIPGLRDSLVKIMQDFNLQVSLREGCQKILIADVLTLMNVLVKQRRRGTRLGGDSVCELCDGTLSSHAGYHKSFVVFYCKHVYHRDCIHSLQGATDPAPGTTAAPIADGDPQLYCPRCRSVESYRDSTARFRRPVNNGTNTYQ